MNNTNQLIKTTGKIVFRPSSFRPLRKKRQIDEAHTIVSADNGLAAYVRWWVDRELHLFLQPPMLGAHVSVFNGREIIDSEKSHRYLQALNGAKITYYYTMDVQQHWKFWVLPVYSEDLMNIRNQCGLKKEYNFHITIGRML